MWLLSWWRRWLLLLLLLFQVQRLLPPPSPKTNAQATSTAARTPSQLTRQETRCGRVAGEQQRVA